MSRLAPLVLVAAASAASAAPAVAERLPRLVEVVAVGDGLFARRDDGVVIVDGHYGAESRPVMPFHVPPSSSPLVADATAAFTVAPRGRDRTWPHLLELRVEPSRRRVEHRLPLAFDARPVAADPRWIHFDDGTRFDRWSRQLAGPVDDELTGHRIHAAVTLEAPRYLGLGLPSVTTYLLSAPVDGGRPDTWSILRRWTDGGIEAVELPAAAHASLADVIHESVTVVLDHRRAIVLGTRRLDVLAELELPGAVLHSAHPMGDEAWLAGGPTDSCPAALIRRHADGSDERFVSLPDEIRVVAATPRELALGAPGSPANRLVIVRRVPGAAYELDAIRLRDTGARVAQVFRRMPAAIGLGAVALPYVIGRLAAEEIGSGGHATAARRGAARRAAARRRALEHVESCLGALPDPSSCGETLRDVAPASENPG